MAVLSRNEPLEESEDRAVRPPSRASRTRLWSGRSRGKRRLGIGAAAAGLLAGALAAPHAHAEPGPELIENGDFANGSDPWWWTDGEGGVSDGRLCLDVPGGTSNPWDVIIGQDNIPIEQGETYELTYTATADPPITVRAFVQQSVDPYAAVVMGVDQITDSTEPISHINTADRNVPQAQVVFQIGGSDEPFTFCLDDVSLRGGAVKPPYDPNTGSPVRVNQHGYLPDAGKHGTFVTEATQPQDFTVDAADGTEVFSGTTTPAGADPSADRGVHTFDFSEVTQPGKGYTVTVDGKTSLPFDIGDGVYSSLRKDSLAFYYHQRSGIEIDAELVGNKYARPAGHVNVEPNQGDDGVTCWQDSCAYTLDSVGGWYDAGDHGKYVVNGGISVAQLLSTYERTLTTDGAGGDGLGDGQLAVPERGNGVPDILDEARWELEWLLTMQVPNGEELAGMAHHKLNDAAWTGLPMRPEDDPEPRHLFMPSTAATLNLAAAAAQGARLFDEYDPKFAKQLRTAAATAWSAAKEHPKMYFDDTNGGGGGGYGDTDVRDEFYWAAAELLLTTGENVYRRALLNSPLHGDTNAVFPRGGLSWQSVAGVGALNLATVPSNLTDGQLADVRAMLTEAADGYVADAQSAGFGRPLDGGYVWGSNSQILNNGVVLGVAHDLTGKAAYKNAALAGLDYVLGRNPLNQSYITGYGERYSENQHHRFWAHQLNANLPNPPAGTIAGGPYEGPWDPLSDQELEGCAPAMCYLDHIESYTTNEVTINWNAPLAWMASFADDLGGSDGGAVR